MRALCGAIITAGALIGLGLTAIGYGLRYAPLGDRVNDHTGHMYGGTALMIIQVALLAALAVGLAVAFLGLMYHHFRRERELERLYGGATGTAPVGMMPGPMGMPAPPPPPPPR
jgi:hypothetical protein